MNIQTIQFSREKNAEFVKELKHRVNQYFKEKGIFNKSIASKFKNNILSKGGTEDPMDLYIKFRGRKPTINALLKRSSSS